MPTIAEQRALSSTVLIAQHLGVIARELERLRLLEEVKLQNPKHAWEAYQALVIHK